MTATRWLVCVLLALFAGAASAAWTERPGNETWTIDPPGSVGAMVECNAGTRVPNQNGCLVGGWNETEATIYCDAPVCFTWPTSVDGPMPALQQADSPPAALTEAEQAADLLELWGLGVGALAALYLVKQFILRQLLPQ